MVCTIQEIEINMHTCTHSVYMIFMLVCVYNQMNVVYSTTVFISVYITFSSRDAQQTTTTSCCR